MWALNMPPPLSFESDPVPPVKCHVPSTAMMASDDVVTFASNVPKLVSPLVCALWVGRADICQFRIVPPLLMSETSSMIC